MNAPGTAEGIGNGRLSYAGGRGEARGFGRVVAVVRLGRPKFLLGGVALFGLGTLLAYWMGFGFNARLYAWGQLAVSAIQLTTHYSNDYFDLEADRANRTPTRWSGGSRVLVRGEIPRWYGLAAAGCCALVACAAVLVLTENYGAPTGLTLLVFGLMLFLSWSYSSPPLRLHSKGWGEATVATVVPFLTPLSGFVLQARTVELLPMLLCVPLILLQLVMLLTLQIPDARGDQKVGKKTWTVMFGARKVVVLCSGLVLASFALSLSSPAYGAPIELAWAWVFLSPLSLVLLVEYARRDERKPAAFNRLAFTSVALFFLAVVANLAGIAAHLWV